MQGEIVWRTCPKCGLLVQAENERCECGYYFQRRIEGRSRFAASVIVCLCVLLVVSVGANAWLFWHSRSDVDLRTEQLAEAQQAGYDLGYQKGYESTAWPAYSGGYSAGKAAAAQTAEADDATAQTYTTSSGARFTITTGGTDSFNEFAEMRDSFYAWEKANK